jgi:plastocyanin
MHRKLWLLPLVALLAVGIAFGAACGDDDNGDDGPISELTEQAGNGGGEATEPAADATEPGGGETPAAEETADNATTPGAGGGGATVEIAAEDSTSFTEDELTAPAGTVTIVFENRDNGVTHNFALYDSEDSPENLIDATELEPGPSTNEITVELEPGTYYFNCQVHPNMEGTLTVE